MKWFKDHGVSFSIKGHSLRGVLNATQPTLGLRACSDYIDVTPERDVRLEEVNRDLYVVTATAEFSLPILIPKRYSWEDNKQEVIGYRLCIFGADYEQVAAAMESILTEGFDKHLPETPWTIESTYDR